MWLPSKAGCGVGRWRPQGPAGHPGPAALIQGPLYQYRGERGGQPGWAGYCPTVPLIAGVGVVAAIQVPPYQQSCASHVVSALSVFPVSSLHHICFNGMGGFSAGRSLVVCCLCVMYVRFSGI